MQRTIDFQIMVLRNHADYALLHPLEQSAPQIRMDDSGEIKTSFSGEFLLPEADVNWLTDEIQPRITIDGTTYDLGVFCPATMRSMKTEGQIHIHVDAYDRGWLVKDHVIEQMRYFPAGTNYITAVLTVLEDCGIALISATPSAAVLAEAREWQVGTSNLTIVNELLAEINYEDIYFDQNGTAMVRPASSAKASQIRHVFDETDIESLMLPDIGSETDIYTAPNVFLCVCSSPDKDTPLAATAANTNPQSPLSIARRGRRIVQVVDVPNIASQEELQSYAFRKVSESMLSAERIEVRTCLLPGFGVRDVVSLQTEELFCLGIERAWTMSLTVGGTMSHEIERVVLNVD